MRFSFLIFVVVLIRQYSSSYFGILNHQTQWHMHCSIDQTSILHVHPSLNERSAITYQCPSRSTSITIVPIDIDFTLLCRLTSRLLWIIVDFYQYNSWLKTFENDDLKLSIRLNEEILLNQSKTEMNHYRNRSILINAFYIPFESVDHLGKRFIDIEIRLENLNRSNQCLFYLRENVTWNALKDEHCHSDHGRNIFVQYARCDFFAPSIPQDTFDEFDENLTHIPDFNVILSIDERNLTTTTTMMTTTTTTTETRPFFNEFDEKLAAILSIITSFSHLLVLMLIFSIMTLILIVILFLYILCYHYHARSPGTSRTSI